MKSRDFFGNYRFKDINVYLYNADGKVIAQKHYTTFSYANPLIREVILNIIDHYEKDVVYNGEPTSVRIFTTPSYKEYVAKIDGKKISNAIIRQL